MMVRKRTLIGILLGVVLLGTAPLLSLAAPGFSRPAQEGQNLLRNPGFEGITCAPNSGAGWCNDNWTRDTFNGNVYQEIYTPQGWVTFWSQGTNPTDGRKYGRPECKVIPRVDPFIGPPARIHGGNYSIMQFGFFRAIDSGVYQVVTGLSPQATVQLSAYAQAWACDDDDHQANSCGDPHQMLFQVGIDPNGGTDPWSPNVIWASGYSYDEHRLIGPAQAQVGDAGTVTVFLRGTAKWAYKHNDVYWDDAALVYTTPPAPPTDTPPPPPPTATPGPSPTPLPPPTPRPDGASVHIVKSGDTLFGIALMYGVDADQIRQLNASSLGPNDLIWPGQELVISLPSEQPTPTAQPAPPTPAPTSVAGSPATEGETGGASVCVLAYHDRNADTFRDSETEELLPNAEFSIADASGVVDRYTSDGISEPYCFTGLATGAYRVIQNAPPGYEPSGPAEWPVAVAEGTSLDIQFGSVRGESPAAPGETTEPTPASEEGNEPADGGSAVSSIFATVAKVSGVLVLLLAAGVAVLFVLNRRRI
jgi:LysM repeat protein